ncbi:MAG: 6-hydroxycyclohex-1-ene-1-carbonyl-CoA dehydrogenase [Polyangiaceae bacterium]|jgi:6-hydroxycyclohex-1-ene-1-carbonyl-CoA dehydrogenase
MHAEGWFLTSPGKPLEHRGFELREPASDEVIVKVDACGVCHTDLAYADGSVAPAHALPLVLGHEIVGEVVRAGKRYDELVGRTVLVPAVLPCGDCVFCRKGRGNACLAQKMPGNHIDGGFATHVVVPAWAVLPVDDEARRIDERELAVAADAVSTAYQAVRRAGLAKGDVAFVVGAGGVGGYVVQIAHALGAHVIACDVSAPRLELMAKHGADTTVLTGDRPAKALRSEMHGAARARGAPSLDWRIFECSGTPAGQLLAFTLLAPAATLVQVGFCAKPIELRFSNVMAFDATIHGSWGAPPDAYAAVLRLLLDGKIAITPFVEHAPMSRVNETLAAMAKHGLERRVILDPRN